MRKKNWKNVYILIENPEKCDKKYIEISISGFFVAKFILQDFNIEWDAQNADTKNMTKYTNEGSNNEHFSHFFFVEYFVVVWK